VTHTAATIRLRLMLARAGAWALLVAGWIGLGSLALHGAPSLVGGFALVALWLLALGAAAGLAARGRTARLKPGFALGIVAAVTAAGLWWTVNGGGIQALVIALIGWAALTALASGVVRSLRLAQAVLPRPPVAPAGLGALAAAIALGDIGDPNRLALRLAAFVAAAAVGLLLLQRRGDETAPRQGCRAGLFDCSLPAWPAGAWREAMQWPTLLAGLAMLPMMAALPLMADWCRADAVAPQAMVLLHLAAMFGPALALGPWIERWSMRALSLACAVLLALGAAVLAWAPAPYDLLGLAAAHGAAWGIAWSGQLWAPERRGRQGASPMTAALGYALLTLAFGAVVAELGPRGVLAVHGLLGLGAVLVWPAAYAASLLRRAAARGEARFVASGDRRDALG
jgi:hypothetical protein